MFPYRLVDLAGTTVFAFLLHMILYNVLKGNIRRSRCVARLYTVAVAILTVYVYLRYVSNSAPVNGYEFIAIMLVALVGGAVYSYLSTFNIFQIMFLYLASMNVMIDTIHVSLLVYRLIDHINHDTVGYFSSAVMGAILGSIFLLYLGTRFFIPAVNASENMRYWRFIWVLPLLDIIMFQLKIISDFWTDPESYKLEELFFLIMRTAALCNTYYVILRMQVETQRSITAKQEASAMARHIYLQKAQYKKVSGYIQETARIRHDMRQHFLSIRGFIRSNDISGLNRYLAELEQSEFTDDVVSVCANHAANIVFSHYISLAKQKGVDVMINADIPEEYGISESDMCIVLGNLMENAVEAATTHTNTQKGFIEIKAHPAGKQLVLLIMNSYEKPVRRSGEGFLSATHDGEGMGIKSVKRIVEKNNGVIRITYDYNTFKVYILF